MKDLNSKMITSLIMEYGMEGYGIYRFVRDCIDEDCNNHITDNDLDIISYAIRVDMRILKEIVSNLGLFLIDEDGNISNISYLE